MELSPDLVLTLILFGPTSAYIPPMYTWPLLNTSGNYDIRHGNSNGDVGCTTDFAAGHPDFSGLDAYHFDGQTNSYVDVNIGTYQLFVDFSILFWVYPEAPFNGTYFHYQHSNLADTTKVTEIKLYADQTDWTLSCTGGNGAIDFGTVTITNLATMSAWMAFIITREKSTGRLTMHIATYLQFDTDNSFPNDIAIGQPGVLRIGGSLDATTSPYHGTINCLHVYSGMFSVTTAEMGYGIRDCLPVRWYVQPGVITKLNCTESTTETSVVTTSADMTTQQQSTQGDMQTTETTTEENVQTTKTTTEGNIQIAQTTTEGNIQTTETTEGNIQTTETTEGNIQTTETTTEGNIQTTETTEGNIQTTETTEGNIQTTETTEGNIQTTETTERNIQTTETTERNIQTTETTTEGNIQTTELETTATSTSILVRTGETTTSTVVAVTSGEPTIRGYCYPTEDSGHFDIIAKNKMPNVTSLSFMCTNSTTSRRCAALCLHMLNCISFSFGKVVGDCKLYTEVSGDLLTSQGHRYYRKRSNPC